MAPPTTTAFTGIVRAPEPSGTTPPRPFPRSTSLRALPCVSSGLAVCAGQPEPYPAAKKPLEPDLDLSGEDIGGGKLSVPHGRPILISMFVVIVSLVLVVTGLPMRAGFLLSRPAFRRHVVTAPASEYEGEALGRFLGIYYVNRFAADPRGGVYLRTHAGADGIGPDTMSYGFAYKPNPKGTPFGNSHYGLSHIVGDWYFFSASNDW